MEVLDNVEEILGELEEFDLNDGDSERDKMFEYVRDIPWAMEELLGIEDTLVKKLDPLVSKIKELEESEDSDRRLEKFQPVNPPYVGMYVCGPTVYGPAHLGHARPAITFDLIFRYLKYCSTVMWKSRKAGFSHCSRSWRIIPKLPLVSLN